MTETRHPPVFCVAPDGVAPAEGVSFCEGPGRTLVIGMSMPPCCVWAEGTSSGIMEPSFAAGPPSDANARSTADRGRTS
jgi:hypothetical protein